MLQGQKRNLQSRALPAWHWHQVFWEHFEALIKCCMQCQATSIAGKKLDSAKVLSSGVCEWQLYKCVHSVHYLYTLHRCMYMQWLHWIEVQVSAR
jgi:hypothetical protein